MVSLALGAALEMARRRIRRPVGRLLAHARGIGAGDLTWPAAPDTGADDEVARLGASMDVMQKSLASLVRDLREGVRTVDGAASEISDANMDLAARTEQTASAIEQAVGRMHDLSDAVHRNATHADRTHRLAASSRDAAEQGRELVRQVIDGMGDIARSTAGISDISSMIEGIAFQTNILALNAAVEARGHPRPRVRGGGRRSAQPRPAQLGSGPADQPVAGRLPGPCRQRGAAGPGRGRQHRRDRAPRLPGAGHRGRDVPGLPKPARGDHAHQRRHRADRRCRPAELRHGGTGGCRRGFPWRTRAAGSTTPSRCSGPVPPIKACSARYLQFAHARQDRDRG
ncbi:HAMP domain-containing protein [Acidovorax citrulli]|nr:HAMP domain-containing protein [Paracidovorax citrulli]